MSRTSTPNDPKVVKALKMIESGKAGIREAVRKTGANRSTVRHHLRSRGWSAVAGAPKATAKAKAKKAKSKAKKAKSKAKPKAKKGAVETHLIASADGERSLTVFIPGQTPVIVSGDHPKFNDILSESAEAKPNIDRLRELADTTVLVSTKFEALTDRITTRNGKLYFDGDELDNSLTQKILSMLDEGDEDWESFVNFMDKLYLNPNPAARDAFYGWLSARPFGITPEGNVVGYKRVKPFAGDGDAEFQSWHDGPAIVNGEEYLGGAGGVPQSVGDVVEKPRSSVDNSTRNECSDGLHVGTYDFARSNSTFGSIVLRLIVNPRDVVGVPTEVGSSAKFRCCRYEIRGVAIGRGSDEAPTN